MENNILFDLIFVALVVGVPSLIAVGIKVYYIVKELNERKVFIKVGDY